MFFKIGSLKNFANFANFSGNIGSQACNLLLKRDSNTGVLLWNLPIFKISNSNNMFKDFSAISLQTTNFWSPTTFTMTNKFENSYTYQNLVPIERLNINNFAVFLHFWTIAKSSGNIVFTVHVFIFSIRTFLTLSSDQSCSCFH